MKFMKCIENGKISLISEGDYSNYDHLSSENQIKQILQDEASVLDEKVILVDHFGGHLETFKP